MMQVEERKWNILIQQAQEDQEHHAEEGLFIQFVLGYAAVYGAAQGKGDGHTGDKQEEGKDEIVKSEAKPSRMRKLSSHGIRPRPSGPALKPPENDIRSRDEKHVESAQGVDGSQSLFDEDRLMIHWSSPLGL